MRTGVEGDIRNLPFDAGGFDVAIDKGRTLIITTRVHPRNDPLGRHDGCADVCEG